MTRFRRAGRAPALFVSLAIVAVAAVALALSITVGSNAAAPSSRSAARAPSVPAAAAGSKAASTSTTRTASAPRAADAGDSPGQMYLTDTDERRGELIHTWDVCLLDHGATQDTSAAMAIYQGRGVTPLVVADPVPAAAKAACADLEPLLPKEEDPSLNPNYVADSQANVACLRAHGIDVHTVPDTSVYPDGLSWTYDTSTTQTPPNEGAIDQACEIQAFTG